MSVIVCIHVFVNLVPTFSPLACVETSCTLCHHLCKATHVAFTRSAEKLKLKLSLFSLSLTHIHVKCEIWVSRNVPSTCTRGCDMIACAIHSAYADFLVWRHMKAKGAISVWMACTYAGTYVCTHRGNGLHNSKGYLQASPPDRQGQGFVNLHQSATLCSKDLHAQGNIDMYARGPGPTDR